MAVRGLGQADHTEPSINRSQRKKNNLERHYTCKTYSEGTDRKLWGAGVAAPFNKETLQGSAELLFL